MNIIHHIELGNVHRFGKRPSRESDPPRAIVARFIIKMINRIGGVMVSVLALECGRSWVRAPVGSNQRQ